jgi:hypothetical protein
MRAAGITALGEPVEALEVDVAPPAADEVLIDVAAAGRRPGPPGIVVSRRGAYVACSGLG